eukprot:5469690-Amphidinium_carterae.1
MLLERLAGYRITAFSHRDPCGWGKLHRGSLPCSLSDRDAMVCCSWGQCSMSTGAGCYRQHDNRPERTAR